jgi:hypothetical protein
MRHKNHKHSRRKSHSKQSTPFATCTNKLATTDVTNEPNWKDWLPNISIIEDGFRINGFSIRLSELPLALRETFMLVIGCYFIVLGNAQSDSEFVPSYLSDVSGSSTYKIEVNKNTVYYPPTYFQDQINKTCSPLSQQVNDTTLFELLRRITDVTSGPPLDSLRDAMRFWRKVGDPPNSTFEQCVIDIYAPPLNMALFAKIMAITFAILLSCLACCCAENIKDCVKESCSQAKSWGLSKFNWFKENCRSPATGTINEENDEKMSLLVHKTGIN